MKKHPNAIKFKLILADIPMSIHIKFRYNLTITITMLPRTHLNATEFIENRVSLPKYLKIKFFHNTPQIFFF